MQLIQNTYFGEGNRYYLEKLLGRGGFSEVWLAKDTITETEEAIKIYAPGQGLDDEGLHIFTKEVNIVRHIHHPNILTASHVGTWNNMPYLIMPYCPNGSLAHKEKTLSEEDVLRVLREVSAGLKCLHSQPVPIIHQDIKPDNILINDSGNYVITDFGISTTAQTTLRKSVRNATMGTAAYMSPERFGQNPLPTKESDIWALGATLFELIEGYAPFGELGGLAQKSGAEIPLIKANISESLKQIIYSMMAINPSHRPIAGRLQELKYKQTHPKKDYSEDISLWIIGLVWFGLFLLLSKEKDNDSIVYCIAPFGVLIWAFVVYELCVESKGYFFSTLVIILYFLISFYILLFCSSHMILILICSSLLCPLICYVILVILGGIIEEIVNLIRKKVH